MVPDNTLTVDTYKSRVDIISKLAAAIAGLAVTGDPALISASEHMFLTLQNLGDSLAQSLAGYARDTAAYNDAKPGRGASVSYYLDDIWEALGRYAYHVGPVDVTLLCGLRYNLEKINEAIAALATAAQVVEAPALDIAGTASEAALDDGVDEFEREQAPAR